MPRNGSGTFTRTDGTRTGSTVWAKAETALVKVNSTDFDTHDQDIADEITNSVAVDGQSTMAGNLKMGGNTITGYGANNVVIPEITAPSSYTPVLNGVGGTLVYAQQFGTHFEIADVVICTINITASISVKPTGAFTVSLPFTAKNTANYYGSASIGSYSGIDNDLGVYGQVRYNTDYIEVRQGVASSDNAVALSWTDIDNSAISITLMALYEKA